MVSGAAVRAVLHAAAHAAALLQLDAQLQLLHSCWWWAVVGVGWRLRLQQKHVWAHDTLARPLMAPTAVPSTRHLNKLQGSVAGNSTGKTYC